MFPRRRGSDAGARRSAAGDASRYFSLRSLALEWAKTAGQPPKLVLRNLCDWIMVGKFPEGSVLTANYEPVDPERIYLAGRGNINEGRTVNIGGFFTVTPSEGDLMMLLGVVISEPGLRAFCDATATGLPPSLRVRPFLSWPRARSDNTAPPSCPDVEDRAAQIIGNRHAQELLRELQRLLAGARDGILAGDNQAVVERALAYFRRRWNSARGLLLSIQSKLTDSDIGTELANLDAQLEAIQSLVLPAVDDAGRSSLEPGTAQAEHRVRDGSRTRHYPQGKIDDWYQQRVLDLQAGDTVPSLSDDWAAAKKAEFADIPRERVREVRDRLAPEAWKKPGPRPR